MREPRERHRERDGANTSESIQLMLHDTSKESSAVLHKYFVLRLCDHENFEIKQEVLTRFDYKRLQWKFYQLINDRIESI